MRTRRSGVGLNEVTTGADSAAVMDQSSTTDTDAKQASSDDTVPFDFAVADSFVGGIPNLMIPGGSQSLADPMDEVPSTALPGPELPCDAKGGNLELLGSDVNILLQAINDLSRYGVDATVPLPKIVAVGDQSAGKSSLIEGISQIRVPRDSGTCTRCPLEIKLKPTPDHPWRCEVSLYKKYDHLGPLEGPALDAADNKLPFFPWTERTTPCIYPIATVHDKDMLEGTIRKAQNACLDLSFGQLAFGNDDEDRKKSKFEFSPNIISLEITGPDLPPLTFYDLPGVIAQVEKPSDGHLVKMVKNLTKYYVQQENTIVMVALPMDQDVQNSKASGILRKLAVTDRCIGVVTKPDRAMNDREHHDWRRILGGKMFELGNGYFVTRQSSGDELQRGISNEEARLIETSFFNSADWTQRFPGTADQVGTSQLVALLSKMLAQQIRKCLPTIKSRIFEQEAKLVMKLKVFPDPPENASQVVSSAISEFTQRVEQRLKAEPLYLDFWTGWQEASQAFKQNILALRPTLFLKSGVTPIKTSTIKRNAFDLTGDDSDSEMIFQTPSKKAKLSSTRSALPLRRINDPPSKDGRKRFILENVKTHLDVYNSSGLPGLTNPAAVQELVRTSLEHWSQPLDRFLENVESLIIEAVDLSLMETISNWEKTMLFKSVRKTALDDVLRNAMAFERTQGAFVALRLEQHKPMTKDADALKKGEIAELRILAASRYEVRVRAHFEQQEPSEPEGNTPSGASKFSKEVTKALKDDNFKLILGPDPFDREVSALASVRAYYDIASSRFIDNVCNYIESGLFKTLKHDLQSELRIKLGLDSSDKEQITEICDRLIEEDEARGEERRSLKEKQKMLGLATETLMKLEDETPGCTEGCVD